MAAEALLRALAGDEGPPGTARVPAMLTVRRSCGCDLTDGGV
jgi:hypothetical protein